MKSAGDVPDAGVTESAVPVLYVFAGLPGTGKTALATRLASRMAAAYLRIDTIEQALRDLCSFSVEGEGYRLAHRVAADNLRLGVSVVADSCNTIDLTRREWEDVALNNAARCRNVEITCSDETEHRRRVETRDTTVQGLRLPSWSDVQNREYEPWQRERIVVDTSGSTIDESFDKLVALLAED